ncbi:AAA ATPase domain-containing protein [Streptomyces sp. cf386]|uniref:nSTAND1 domain-containing NTPase n=1 Tax=Streptomyces sp. cf386 TaxID=1761904 RepID=UPI000885AFAF|nr:trypsin-like peptidase domain-containing protein [Streptomyces sp. cf386]SDO81872.1 AAA ATPase domain-containing protein [Streptomyces sp. cf386]
MTLPALPPERTGGPGLQSLDAAVLRVRDGRGDPVGVAFLVSDTLALTCAHVVHAALGTTGEAAPPASARIQVDLPLVPAPQRDGGAPATTAGVEHWVPPRAPDGGSSVSSARDDADVVGPADVAVLRLEAPLPGAGPVQLVDADELWGHPVRAFGLPAGRPGGVWHAGVLRGRQADGWVQADLVGNGYPVSRGFSGGPVWDDRLSGVVGMVAVAESGQPPVSYLIPTGGLLAARPELRAVTLPPSPFRALSAFQETDAAIFHGRRAESDEAARALAAERRVTVVGPSGSGKSSLALAGVAPRLRAEGAQVVVVRPTPGSSPLTTFAAAVLPLLEPDLPEAERPERTAELVQVLRRHGPADVVARLLQLRRGSRLLVVVDQFEEVLGLAPDAVDELADLLQGDTLPATVRVLITLRADFLEPVLAHPRFGPQFGGHLHALAPPTPESLREIVTVPVEAVPGLSYEPHLAERILADTGTGPGALPLLGLTLDLLWQRQQGGLLTHRAYEELGGVTGALGKHADRVWKACVPPEDEEAARRLFTRLVRVPVGTPAPIRRMVLRTELRDEQWRVAQRLAGTRLLATGHNAEGTETVELAHEALISDWDKLADWTTGDRAFLEWRAALQQDMDRWEHAGRPSQLLPTPLQLARSERWLSERRDELTDAERHYLDAGRAHRRARVRRRRTALSAVGLVVALVLVALSLLYATREESRERAADAASRALAVAAEDDARTEPALGVLKALAAHHTAPTTEARNALLRQYLRYHAYDRVLSGVLGTVRAFTISRNGDVVLATSQLGRAVLYVGATSGRVRSAQVPSTGQVLEVVVSADGKRGAYVQADGKAVWFEVDTDAAGLLGPLHRLPDAPGSGVSWDISVGPALSADGRLLAARVRGRLVWWNLDRGALAGDVPAPQDMNTALWFGPDGRTLLTKVYTASGAQALKSVDMGTGRATQLLSEAQNIFVSGDRRTAVVCREEGDQSVVSRHRTSDGAGIGRPYREREEAYRTDLCTVAAVDATGGRVALGWGGNVRVVNLDRGEVISGVSLPEPAGTDFTPALVLAESHGRLYYAGRQDSMIALVNLIPRGRLPKAAQQRLTADGKRTMTVLQDGSRMELRPADPKRSGQILARVSRGKPYWVPGETDLPVFDATGGLVADREARDTVVVRDTSTLRKVAAVTAVRPPKTRPGTRLVRDLDVSGALTLQDPKYEFRYFFDHTGHLLTVSGTVLQQWDPRTGRQTARFDAGALRPDGDPDALMTIAPYPGRNKVSVIVQGRPGIRVVDITDGRVTDRVRTEDDVLSAQFGPGGRYFAVMRRDTGLEVWRRGNPARRVIGPLSSVGESSVTPYRAVFLDDDRFLVAADDAVRIYRFGERGYDAAYLLADPTFATGDYSFLDVSEDGRTVLKGGTYDGSAVVLDPELWRQELCRVVGDRAFTEDERDDLPAEAETRQLCA